MQVWNLRVGQREERIEVQTSSGRDQGPFLPVVESACDVRPEEEIVDNDIGLVVVAGRENDANSTRRVASGRVAYTTRVTRGDQ